MAELLHAGSLAAAGIGACCVALDGPRPRVRELALSVVMVLAMLDVVLGVGLVPTVVWSTLTLALAMALAVRRRGAAEPEAVARMRVVSGIGAVLMAALMLVMSAGSTSATGHHGMSSAAVSAALLAASVGYAAACGVVMIRGHARPPASRVAVGRVVVLDRLQLGSMSAAVLLLAIAHAFA